MHERLSLNLSLSKLKLMSQKNILNYRYLLLYSPKAAIADINQARVSDAIGTNSFFISSLNDDIFNLGSIQNVKDSGISISKITPF